jgi:hypothetical protein
LVTSPFSPISNGCRLRILDACIGPTLSARRNHSAKWNSLTIPPTRCLLVEKKNYTFQRARLIPSPRLLSVTLREALMG